MMDLYKIQVVIKHLLVIAWAIGPVSLLLGQSPTDSSHQGKVPAYISRSGDTVLMANLKPIYLTPNSQPASDRRIDMRRYSRLVYNLKKVYPYAKIAKKKLEELNVRFETLKSDKEKKEYVKQVESEMWDQFSGQIKDLTDKQGLLLIKLIDRETGQSSYELVRELRGSFRTFFYQTLARIYGMNLKAKYDPEGEDKAIEEILRDIDAGIL
jgi:hypothetical protein